MSAMGLGAAATGDGSLAIGGWYDNNRNNKATDFLGEFEPGETTIATGEAAVAVGNGVIANGQYSAAFGVGAAAIVKGATARSEEHTSELQSLMRISYAVFCLKKKNNKYSV